MAQPVWAIQFPQGLLGNELNDVIEILGLSTSSKTISNPYPLGGYLGLEIGVALEIIDTTNLSRLGNGLDTDGDPMETEKEFRYPRISIGKGIYADIDVFFQFIPYSQATDVSEYGGFVKWSFYQAKFFPINLSLLAHANVVSFNNVYTNQNIGLEAMAGINVKNVAIYFGGGPLEASSDFSGSVVDATVSSNSQDFVQRKLRDFHTFIGASIQVSDFFIAAQIDRYSEPVFSAKLGLRL